MSDFSTLIVHTAKNGFWNFAACSSARYKTTASRASAPHSWGGSLETQICWQRWARSYFSYALTAVLVAVQLLAVHPRLQSCDICIRAVTSCKFVFAVRSVGSCRISCSDPEWRKRTLRPLAKRVKSALESQLCSELSITVARVAWRIQP